MLRHHSTFAALLVLAAPANALGLEILDESDIGRATPPGSFSVLQTFGDEKCPDAPVDADVIVVCGHEDEPERYRIPKKLRDEPREDMAGVAWPAAVETIDGFARANMPNSCSVNGSYGQTGCTQALLQQWFAERRGKLDATAN